MEKVIATIGNNAMVLDDAQREMDKQASEIEFRAHDVVVSNEYEYIQAGELLKAVKQQQKKVKDYWEPMRISAKESYDNILAHKKAMLEPLEKAEMIIKEKTTTYIKEQERIRRAQEEKLRKLAAQEVDSKLELAARAEAEGDTVGAEYAMAEAEIMDTISVNVKAQTPKASGISHSKTWRITAIDSSKVPVSFGGVEIRPVDERAVLRLIKESKGTIHIPGVVFEETVTTSVRA
jgi:hypothetical protein